MSQSGRYTPAVPPGKYVEQIDGDIGSATGAVITFNANPYSGSSVFFQASGSTVAFTVTDANGNTIIGADAGNSSLTGTTSVGLGYGALEDMTSGTHLVMIGYDAGNTLTSAADCIGIGYGAFGFGATNPTKSIGIGTDALIDCDGAYNVALGYQAGHSYASSESSNILINNTGTVSESNVMRLGAGTGTGNGQLANTYISGINGVNVGSVASVVSISGDHVGSTTITAGTNISVTAAANTITIATSGAVANEYVTDSGTAIPSGGILNITGGTTGLTFDGSGNTVSLTNDFLPGAIVATTGGLMESVTGTSGYVLTSNNASAPSFQALPASTISITGDSGGALVSHSFTFTGGTTGLTFAGSGTTETLGGTLKLANGGTNASLTASNGGIFYSTATAGALLSGTATADQVLLSGASTTPAWSTATYPATTTINQLLYSSANNVIGGVTAGNYGVLISSSSGVPSWLANGTTGQILTATTSGTPSWENASASSISITGDSGGALVGAAFTFTGGTTGLTFAGSGSTETLGGTLKLANGGTNASLTASNGGIFYSSATAGAILAGTATANQVLLSGSSSAPAWSTATYPATTTINQLLYSSANNVVGGITAGNYGVLISSSSGVPSWLANGTTGQVLTATTSGTPSWENAAASGIVTIDGDTGSVTGSTVTFNAGSQAGKSFSFSGSGTTMSFNTTDANGNIYLGKNTGVAAGSSFFNTVIGSSSGEDFTSGQNNVAIGYSTMQDVTSGSNNVALGYGSLQALITGGYNTCIGVSSGENYTGSEGSNIILGGNVGGTAGESHVLRIGNGTGTGTGQQNEAFISGINGITVSTADQVLLVNSSDQIGSLAHGTSGQVLTSGGSGANPTWTTPAAAFTWSVITANQTAAINNGYICNKAGTLALALPTTAAVGSLLEVTGINTATGWQITQAAGQQIFFGTSSTTSGTGGSLTSSAIRDAIRLVCVVANTTWQVLSSIGNITVV